MTIVRTLGYLPIERARWRNLITGECRDTPPPLGELDWIEGVTRWHCPD